jgi:AP-1 complex subunit beta-1
MNLVCPPEKSGGLEIFAGFRQLRKKIRLEMEINNVSGQQTISSLAIQLNKNSFGLTPSTQQVQVNPPAAPGGSGIGVAELSITPNMLAPTPAGQPASPQVQVAIKNMQSGSVFYFAVNFNLEAMFTSDGQMERSAFIESWKSIDDRNELYGAVSDLPRESVEIETVQQKFLAYNIFFIARRPVPNAEGQEVVYFSMKTMAGMVFLAELTFKQGVNACKICLKTESGSYGLLAKKSLEDLLRS